ncbi:MAG: VanZ family protein [Chloracidobacterium sp.]|nr:VanZ family protein [Chloracidobacterium sp.]MDW8217578.1 VanZ family protein [Acidobacteriota bacterium]
MTNAKGRWWWLLLPIGWMGAIFVFSSDWLAWRNTAPLARIWLHWWLPNPDPQTTETFHLILRKLGHVTEYALLALLWYVALRRANCWSPRQAGLGAAVVSILYAGLDEWRQTFTVERIGSPADVGFDSLGVLLGLSGVALLHQLRALRSQLAAQDAYRTRPRKRPRYSYVARSD